jgi:hypothetical protein
VLYGIGARLDQKPELLFLLRKVDEKELIAKAGKGIPISKKRPAADRVLKTDDLSEMFGLEMGAGDERLARKPGRPAEKSVRRKAEKKRGRPPKSAVPPAAGKKKSRKLDDPRAPGTSAGKTKKLGRKKTSTHPRTNGI